MSIRIIYLRSFTKMLKELVKNPDKIKHKLRQTSNTLLNKILTHFSIRIQEPESETFGN